MVFSRPDRLLDYLIDNPREPYTVYYRNNDVNGRILAAMLGFTNDGALIAGLSVYVPITDDGHAIVPDASSLAEHLAEIARTVGGKLGYWTFEEPPPITSTEFAQRLGCVGRATVELQRH